MIGQIGIEYRIFFFASRIPRRAACANGHSVDCIVDFCYTIAWSWYHRSAHAPFRGIRVNPTCPNGRGPGRIRVCILLYLSRGWEHFHARALQIRAELSTHIHRETGPKRPTPSFWSFLFEKTKLAAKSHRLFASARRTTLYAMPPAAGQPAALQGTEPGQELESVPRTGTRADKYLLVDTPFHRGACKTE